MDADKNFLVGIFDDDELVLNGVDKVRASGVKIHEVYSPFPVHGLDEKLGYKRTRLPIAAFLFGMTGTSLALLMQIWMLGYDWPMIIGGKNFTSLPPIHSRYIRANGIARFIGNGWYLPDRKRPEALCMAPPV